MDNAKLSYDLVFKRITTGVYDVKYSKPNKKEGPRKLENDLKEALMNEHGLNADQADKVYRKAYEDGYSAATVASNDVPFKEMLKESNLWILWEAQELGELTEAVLKLS